MPSTEIKLVDYELKESQGNLKTLLTNWESVPDVPAKVINKSSGVSAIALKGCLNKTKKISNSMSLLLGNTFSFFEKAGVAFLESDSEASKNIDTITTK